MAFNFAGWVAASTTHGREQPGARALWNYCHDRWPFGRFGGIYVPRTVAGSNTPSHHAEGRAIDFMIAPLAGGAADAPKGAQLVDSLGPHGQRLGIDTIIWNRMIWSRRAPRGKKYKGEHPHHDHVHIGLTREAAASLDHALIASIVDGTPVTPMPTLGAVTHVVAATDLAFRKVPSAADPATVITRLQPGDELAQLPAAAQNDGQHNWIKVQTVIRRAISEGWVATDSGFLKAVAPAATSTDATTRPQVVLEGVTHVVAATDLAFRKVPSAADPDTVITRLQPGDKLAQLPAAAQNDGQHNWIKVRSLVRGRMTEGWVADDAGFLKAID
jgi:hypothetical protein